MRKPKIAILGVKYYPSRGGVSRVVEDTLVQLKDQFEFTVYCYKHPEAEGNIPGVKVIQIPKFPLAGIGVFLFYLRCAFHARRKGDYDLIHIHKTDAAFILPLLTKKFKCIATSHEAPYKRDKWSGIGKAFFRRMERTFMKSDALLTSISKPLSEYYYATYGRDVKYIPNGVDTEIEPDNKAAEEILAKNKVEGPYVFFAARRIMGTKGAHHMLEALKKINYTGNVVIAGDTDQLPAYTKKIKELSKGLNVYFIGYVAGKSALMGLVKNADLFIFPSETEGMSIMLLEVGSMGRPVIASDIPENTAVFTSADVLFFKNKDANDLAEKFSWAQAHPDEMEKIAQTARAKVLSEYNRPAIAAHYAKLYIETVPDYAPTGV